MIRPICAWLVLAPLASCGLEAFPTTSVRCAWEFSEPARAARGASCQAWSDGRMLQIDARLDDVERLRIRLGTAPKKIVVDLSGLWVICPGYDGFAFSRFSPIAGWAFTFAGDDCRPRLTGSISGEMP